MQSSATIIYKSNNLFVNCKGLLLYKQCSFYILQNDKLQLFFSAEEAVIGMEVSNLLHPV